MSRRLGEEGEVVLLLLVSEEGRIAKARVARSSGFARLDKAALEATENWTPVPSTVDGKAVCSWGRFAINFRLMDHDRDELTRVLIQPSAARALAALTPASLQEDVSYWSGEMIDRPAFEGLTDAVMQSHEMQLVLDDAQHDALAILSLELSEADLSEAARFLESRVGSRLLRVNSPVQAQVMESYGSAVLRTGCAVMQLRRTLSAAAPGKDFHAGSVPKEFRDAMPRLIQQASPYCNCVTRRSSWVADMHKHIDPAPGVTESCGTPPDLKWQ